MGLNVENHAAGPGRPKGFTHLSARQRQDECYRLYLMGLNMTEIAESLGIDRSSVSRYVHKSLQKGSWSDKTYREKFTALFQQTYDQTMLVQRELWKLHLNPETKNHAEILGRILAGIVILMRFIPDLETIKFEEIMIELQKAIDEKRQALEMTRFVP